MACLTKHRGAWKLRYVDSNGVSQSLYPGPMPKKSAEGIKRHLESLLAALKSRTAVPDETAAWVAACGEVMRAKLHRHGLIEAPAESVRAVTIGEFTASYIANRGDAKTDSKVVWKRCRRLLVKMFGPDRTMPSLAVADAKDWRHWMLREGRGPGRGLAENTVRKMCSVACQFFTDARDRGLVTENPFVHRDIPKTTRENRRRDFFVTREIADKVLKACTDDEFRLIFALSRFGGLRCPSEHLSLRWPDVQWDAGRIVVTSPKTAHHPGKDKRIIPLFPELLALLRAVYDAAADKEGFVITRYRMKNTNLRTRLMKTIKRAGLKPWPKLFHNLRASRETELAADHPIHVVCNWIGNSIQVASRNYLQVREEDFAAATVPTFAPMTVTASVGQEVTVSDAANRTGEQKPKKRAKTHDDVAHQKWTLQDSNL